MERSTRTATLPAIGLVGMVLLVTAVLVAVFVVGAELGPRDQRTLSLLRASGAFLTAVGLFLTSFATASMIVRRGAGRWVLRYEHRGALKSEVGPPEVTRQVR